MSYVLDEEVFKRRLLDLGFRSLSAFASQNHIHRNTLLGFLHGKTVFSNAFFKLAHVLEIDPLKLLRSLPSQRAIENIEEIQKIISWLTQQDQDMVVLLFGSRAQKKASKYSDWDIGIFRYPRPISGREFLKVKCGVGELSENLIRSVDLVNLNQAPSWFLDNLKVEEILFLDGNQKAFIYLKGVLDGVHQTKVA
ncbi:MAG: nucleotidyltransferase domain-containing protein [Chlamydiae bacterium]|nr:nucleotidyltransferase domain-containing protein [Chlamydiota bacterium]MBI3277496.1 nucleotidyltransferase domain-containing protein [Chlamydiota bacterium]